MSFTSMGAKKQIVLPPQRGVFPLDHLNECGTEKDEYIVCLQNNNNLHHKCQLLSKNYLQCRMNNNLMSQEDLNTMGYDKHVINPQVPDRRANNRPIGILTAEFYAKKRQEKEIEKQLHAKEKAILQQQQQQKQQQEEEEKKDAKT